MKEGSDSGKILILVQSAQMTSLQMLHVVSYNYEAIQVFAEAEKSANQV